eukprot:2769005-Pyramimonas_sp.AAC.1
MPRPRAPLPPPLLDHLRPPSAMNASFASSRHVSVKTRMSHRWHFSSSRRASSVSPRCQLRMRCCLFLEP